MGIDRDGRHKLRETGGKRAMYRKKRKFNLGRPAANTKIGEERIRKIRTRGGHYKLRALRLETGNFAWASENVTRKSRIIRVVYNATSNELVRTNTLVKNCIIEVDAAPFRLWYEQHYGISFQKKRSDDGKAPSKGKKEPVAKKEGKEGESKEEAKKEAKKDEKKPAGVKKGIEKKGIEKKDSAKKEVAKKSESKDKKEGKEVKKGDKKEKKEGKEAKEEKEGKKGKKDKEEKKEGEEKEKKPQKGLILPNGTRATRKTKEVREKLKIRTRQKTRHLEAGLESQLSTGRIYVCVSSRPGQTGRCDGYILEGKELEFYVKKLAKKKSK